MIREDKKQKMHLPPWNLLLFSGLNMEINKYTDKVKSSVVIDCG